MNARIRGRLLFVSLVASQTLAGCGLFGDKEDTEGPSAAPPAPPGAGATDSSGALPLPTATPAGPGATPPRSPVTTTGAGAKADAGTPTDAGTPIDAGTPTDAGAGASANSAKLKACAEKCQAVMVNCLTPTMPTDGGFPQIKDPAACQAAANSCRTACTP